VNIEKDAALLNEIQSIHDETPGVITTSTAENAYQTAEETLPIAETKHFGNVLGSNEFETKRVGAVFGSNHYGDQFIKRWGAYAGETIDVDRSEGKGDALDYGEFGNQVHSHMREHDTLQAAMRFGRDGNGAAVYVHTDTLPEWVPIAGEGQVLNTWSDGMRSVMKALEDLESGTTAAVASHPAVDVCQRQVSNHLETLRERGVLSRERDADDGRRFIWFDACLDRVDDHGEVELPTTEMYDCPTSSEVDELSRNTVYTCEFVKIDPDTATVDTVAGQSSHEAPTEDTAAANTGPPDD
jgi:hypothetical protein